VKLKIRGFTLVELLVVITTIAILLGLLVPAVNTVRTMARQAKQKAELNMIELAIVAYKNDIGDYPPSSPTGFESDPGNYAYCGSQKLVEALLGWDLLGFDPNSVYRADGRFRAGGDRVYDDFGVSLDDSERYHLKNRKGPYLELSQVDVFEAKQLFANITTFLEPDRYLLCDGFGARTVTDDAGEVVRAGTPILYYRANPNSKDHDGTGGVLYENRIYNIRDNGQLVELNSLTNDSSGGREHPIEDEDLFYEYIRDPQRPITWPYRSDTYLLISAGPDGLYGTKDDIRNF